MIEVENLSKSYGPYQALHDISFNVAKGEILGFLGPNGAGKTTTMRILTGYLPPSAGRIRVAGLDLVKQSVEARRHIGYLPETVPLYTEMSVSSYLDYMAKIKGIGTGRRVEVNRVMEQVGLGQRAKQHISKLSRGYK